MTFNLHHFLNKQGFRHEMKIDSSLKPCQEIVTDKIAVQDIPVSKLRKFFGSYQLGNQIAVRFISQ